MKKKILIITSVVFVISSVLLTIESVTTSAEVSSLQTKQAALAASRRDLQGDLVKAVSTSDLTAKGEDLGFVKPSNLIYLEGTTNVASKN